MFKKTLITVVVLIVAGIAYYGVSPLFKNIVVHDEVPASLGTEMDTEQYATSTEVFPVIGTTGHPASGSLRVIQNGEQTFVRYEAFKTINGPDLFVYLSKDLDAHEFVNLGSIRGTEGDINYEVPEGVSLDEYRYVLTWCKQFGVLFNYVDLWADAGEETQASDSTESATSEGDDSATLRTAIMGTGCFWCVEHDFAKVKGVTNVVSGYAGGETENPTYENYGKGGHREVVEVTYDPRVVSYGNLVEHTIKYGDPTDPDGSFYDRGKKYAPVIYYESDTERDEALAVIQNIDALAVYEKPITIDVLPSPDTFWPAEAYHQDYAEKNPIRYSYYRARSGRTAFIEKHWGDNAAAFVASLVPAEEVADTKPWEQFSKPSESALRAMLTPLAYAVTQEDDTEEPFKNAYDKNYAEGIYVDVVSGEPLFFSKDKYDSGTGWPSFVKPISPDVVVLTEDNTLFTTRTEVRSRYADSHLGHVFDDGPPDRGGKRYCMNSAALRFISKEDMEDSVYAYLIPQL